jgi:hypothetical protein
MTQWGNRASLFWEKVEKTPTCWLWIAARDRQGYGKFSVADEGVRSGKRVLQAHRHAWALTNGPIPAGLYVLHKCDVPACVNPDHLFVGTHRDNMDDKVQKLRHWTSPRRLVSALVAAIPSDIRAAVLESAARGIGCDPSEFEKSDG